MVNEKQIKILDMDHHISRLISNQTCQQLQNRFAPPRERQALDQSGLGLTSQSSILQQKIPESLTHAQENTAGAASVISAQRGLQGSVSFRRFSWIHFPERFR